MAERKQIRRTCSRCGGETFAFPITLGKIDALGKKVEKDVVLGGHLCETCSDADERERQVTERRELLERNLAGASFPADLRGVDFSGFTQLEAVKLAKAWGAGQLKGLCLTGDVGVGKTRLAAAATWQLMHRRRVRWVDVAQLVSALRASFSDAHRAEATRVVTGIGPATFDDLDKVNPTDYCREVLFASLNARLANGSPILVTTNLPLPELGDMLGKPIMSRLAGYCEVVEMVGPDRRIAAPAGIESTRLRAA